MGAGKSTIGRQLAAKQDYEFVDTDNVIEERTGADIPWIFDVEGEDGFRVREANVLADVVTQSDIIIATGGGIILLDKNREKLRSMSGGIVVYLRASVEQLVERTYRDKKRPLLQVDDPKAKIIELFEFRDPLYREIADHVVSTDGCTIKSVVQKISDFADQS